MSKIRKQHSKSLKFKATLEMIKSDKTVDDISRVFGIHQSVLHKWKKFFMEKGEEIFEDGRSRKKEEDFPTKENLESKVGRLVMENEFLKKVLGQ